MGFLDDLLLGEGPEFQTRSLSTIAPEQREALNQLIAQMQGRTPTQYQGQMSAGLSPFEQASLSALEERSKALAAPDPTLQAAGGAVQRLTDFEGQTADASAFFKSNVQDPMLESFQREILPQISRNFGGADFFSTERQASEGLAREDLLESLTAQRTSVELDQFNRARDRALQAAGLAPGLSQAENQRTQTQIDILKAAGIEREVEQAGLDRQYQEFARQREEQQHIDEQLRQLTLTPTIENLAMEDPGSAGLIATLLGALAQGAGRSLGNGIDWGDLWSTLFGGGNGSSQPNGGSPADGPNTGTTVRDIPPVVGGGAVGGATPSPTPGGQVTITDQNGNPVHQQPQPQGGVYIGPSAGGLGGAIAGSIGAGLLTGGAPAGSAIITEAGGQLAHQVGSAAAGSAAGAGGVSTAAAESAGAAAGAPAGSGGSIASGVGTAVAVVGALYGAYSTYEAAAAGDKQGAVLSGAATGAAIGSVVPVIGTAVGAVIGAVVGLVGAAFGNKENASELAYGSYKKAPSEATVRNWTNTQIGGAMFEAVKSHTKSGNVNRFKDVAEMYEAFGITHNAHKQVANVTNQMQAFIKGVVETAQAAGGLPTDPNELAKLDGQQIYAKLVKPAMAAKIEEMTGKPATSNSWSVEYNGQTDGYMQNIFADYTDWLTSHWGQDPNKVNVTPRGTHNAGGRTYRER